MNFFGDVFLDWGGGGGVAKLSVMHMASTKKVG